MTNTVITRALELLEIYDLAKGWYARDANGGEIDISNADACSFCSLGFLGRAAYDICGMPSQEYEDAENAISKLVRSIPGSDYNIPKYNDRPGTTKQDIIDLFTRANKL